MSRFFLIGILLSRLLFADRSAADLPPPYANVELLHFDDFGWYGNGSQLKNMILLYGVNIVVEVGSYIGKSTRHVASLLPPEGKIYAVDHWLGSMEHQSGDYCHTPVENLYRQFLSNVIHAGLTDKIIP